MRHIIIIDNTLSKGYIIIRVSHVIMRDNSVLGTVVYWIQLPQGIGKTIDNTFM